MSVTADNLKTFMPKGEKPQPELNVMYLTGAIVERDKITQEYAQKNHFRYILQTASPDGYRAGTRIEILTPTKLWETGEVVQNVKVEPTRYYRKWAAKDGGERQERFPELVMLYIGD